MILSKPFLEYARRRIEAFLEEFAHIAESEFPYQDSEDALNQLRSLFKRKLDRLRQFTEKSHEGIVKRECTLSLGALWEYLPRLGFILRSTNVRNAFELFGPILRLAREVLEPKVPKGKRKTRLLLSSEWEYSLLTFREDPYLPNFVLIGLPAHESANPLLLPLVGHELGHSVWAKRKLQNEFAPRIAAEVVKIIAQPSWRTQYEKLFQKKGVTVAKLLSDLDLRKTWQPSMHWALRQAEETFCDFLGLNIFGPSFLKAFAYLLSPNHGHGRSLSYPSFLARIENQIKAAQAYGIAVPNDYDTLFAPDAPMALTPGDSFRLAMADEALKRTTDEIIKRVEKILDNTNLTTYTDKEVETTKERLCALVPAENSASLSEILNAAWQVYDNYPKSWNKHPQIKKGKAKVLKELVLKTIEVFEIKTIQEDGI
jgi:hypothetical protein